MQKTKYVILSAAMNLFKLMRSFVRYRSLRMTAIGGLLVLALAPRVHAEATIELFADFGFMTPPDPIAWPTGLPTISTISAANAPEGRDAMRFTTPVPGGWGLLTPTAVGSNLSSYSGGSLRFWMKTTMNMNIEIEHSGNGTKSSVTLPNTGGQWQEFNLILNGPNRSFNSDVNVSNVQAMFLASGVNLVGGYTAEFDDIRWTKAVAGLSVYPKVVDVNFNSNRQFTVEGYDAVGGESIFLYSTFNNQFPIGNFSPFNPSAPSQVQSSRFTANAAGGNLNFSYTSFSTAALVNNTFNNLRREWGLLSETVPGIVLNTNAFLGISTSPIGGNVQISVSTIDKREGNESTFVSLNSPANGFAGFFIQHGLALSGDNVTKDMSHYFDGSLRFWFKGPPALQNILEVGVRSGNVRPGRELSKVNLSSYVAFDNQWHAVVIPITDFTGPRPFADLARTKVYVSFFAVGNTGGSQGIFIDNLRWDSSRPGPLASIALIPNPISAPLSSSRIVQAQGFDASGFPVDSFPTWSTSGPIGTVSPLSGPTTILSASPTASSGSITATQGTVSSSVVVNVADPNWTQSYNIYSDLGSGGFVGVAQNVGSTMNLTEISGGAPEGTTFRRASGNLQFSGSNDGFAVWFTNVDGANGTRYMAPYNNGYLHFWVKTSRDLLISVRSANIAPGTELSRVWLSDLGIPANNQFHRVIIPMADLKALEPALDFTQIQTFFAVTVLTSRGGANSYTFDIDDVKWLTSSTTVPDPTKVLNGLLQKQAASGLVRSYDTLPRAVTYDQALAAMAFTFNQHYTEAQNIFNVYLAKFNAGGFAGFHEEYDVVSPGTIIDADRISGPNAWMLLALMHYRNVRGSGATTQYEAMIDGLAAWLLGLQDTGDGAVRYGFAAGIHPNEKSTEHNFDCISAFKVYAEMRNNNTYRTAATNIANWLQTQMYVPAQNRFNVGEYGATGLPNTDRALDAYSWAPLATASYANVLNTAIVDLSTRQICALTGNLVEGFDFSGSIGQPVDKDAVWIEGTAQMSMAFYATGNSALGDFYANELDKAIVNVSPTTQGLPYATNAGTAYGFTMDPNNSSASSAAWYLFMKQKFNPLQPSGLYGVAIKNISNHQVSPSVGFTANVPASWVRSDQYLEIYSHPISIAPWGLQIYTNNTAPNALPRYLDPTPGNTINLDSDPSGLGWLRSGISTTSVKLPLSWRVQDSSAPVPSAIAPYTLLTGGSGQQFNWSYMKDRATPAIDADGNGQVADPVDGTAFQDGEEYVIVKDTRGIHSSQGPAGFVPSFSPDYLYLQADFGLAAAQQTYQTNTISFEFYFQ